MPQTLLQQFLNAGHLPLDADDSQFQKIMEATKSLQGELSKRPADVVGAVLLGLDADAPGDDPLFDVAEDALKASWTTVRRKYADRPRMILRAMLLDACHRLGLADEKIAAIAWLTAHDYQPSSGLCPEHSVVRAAWMELGERTERRACSTLSGLKPPQVELPRLQMTTPARPRHAPETNIYSTTVPDLAGMQQVPANQQPHVAYQWCTTALMPWAESLRTSVAKALVTAETRSTSSSADHVEAVLKAHHATLNEYSETLRTSIDTLTTAWAAQREVDDPRLDALWWSQALYSPQLSKSYREFEPVVAAVAMAIDLAVLMPAPAPASVAYLLGETTGRLPRAGFDERYTLDEILDGLRGAGQSLRPLARHTSPPAGRVPALVFLEGAIHGRATDDFRGGTGMDPTRTTSLPALAMATFRALQARALGEAR